METLEDAIGWDVKEGKNILFTNTNERLDYIFHFAATVSIVDANADPLASEINNVLGTIRLLDLARKTGARFIFASSSAVGQNIPYGIQKQACEAYIEFYHRNYGVKYTILRYFNVFGERMRPDLAIPVWLEQRSRGEALTVRGDGSMKRDYIYVGDAVKKTLALKDTLGTFEVGSGIDHTTLEVARTISDKIKFVPEEVGEMKSTKSKSATPTLDVIKWLKELV